MKKLLILICFVSAATAIYLNMVGSSDGLVAVSEFAENGGIEKVDLEGVFDPEDFIEQGHPTIIEFYAEDCVGCKVLHNSHYPQFLPLRPDVAVKQILLPRGWNPDSVENTHGIRVTSTPFIIIYGPDGQLLASDAVAESEGFDFLYSWMNDEIQKSTS